MIIESKRQKQASHQERKEVMDRAVKERMMQMVRDEINDMLYADELDADKISCIEDAIKFIKRKSNAKSVLQNMLIEINDLNRQIHTGVGTRYVGTLETLIRMSFKAEQMK